MIDATKCTRYLRPFLGFTLWILSIQSYSQELEPRALTNLPVGMNFALVGYAYTQGNLLFDPALPLEDAEAKLHTIVGAYVRSINFFGLSDQLKTGICFFGYTLIIWS